MLTKAALRTASPAMCHSSQQASTHPVLDTALANQCHSKAVNCKHPELAGSYGDDLKYCIWLQAGITDGGHQIAKSIWLEEQEDIDCTKMISR